MTRPPGGVLHDPAVVRLDDAGRSRAYFFLRGPVTVDRALIGELKEIASGLGGRNVRICLHEGPTAAFHEMIIFERPGVYSRPHKHLVKGESYHLIEGSMGAFVFDEEGAVVNACVLEAAGNFIYRVGVNTFHAVMPLGDFVIYHEAKPGPFTGDTDSIYPPWAPDGRDAAAAARYTDGLRRMLGRP